METISMSRKERKRLEAFSRVTLGGMTLAAECLAKEDGVTVSVTTLRRWLLQEGLLERRRKRRRHRRRRTRRERLGELVQMDGSHHDWFEGRRGWAVLMVMIDDATGRVTARFYENESWASSSDLFQRYARRHGLRVVAKDWTLRWRNRVMQLPRETAEFIRSGQRVTVCEPLDGVVRVFAGDREVSWSAIVTPPQSKPAKRTGPTGSNQGQKPSANHPWRRRRRCVASPKPSVALPAPA
jgi:hypothetical protein